MDTNLLMTREEFRNQVLTRDDFKCIICGSKAQDAHHILERRLFSDGGYYLNNGASLCGKCHIEAEKTLISVEKIRYILNITNPILPDHFYYDVNYDKWGNIIMPNGLRLRGELFYDTSVQKILNEVIHLFQKYIKYPRTYHLPWSNGTKDDRFIKDASIFENYEVVVTEKMDGENTTLYNDYIHARSIEYDAHESRNFVKLFHWSIAHNIPENYRICCENVSAVHSIYYNNLKHCCFAFSIWDANECISWNETLEWLELIGIKHVPILYEGIFDRNKIHEIYENISKDRDIEGYVVRKINSFNIHDFKNNVAKFVRKNHVSDANHHWKYKKVIFNIFDKNVLK